MDPTKLIVCALAAIPAGWFAGVLFDRIPSGEDRLFSPFPGLRLSGPYLAIHATVLVLYLGAAVRFADASWWLLAPYLVLFCSLTALSAIDFDLLRLPDRIVVPTLLVSIPLIAVASIAMENAVAIQRALLGSAVYFGFLFVFHLIFGNRGMGFGDVKMASVLGLYLGWLGGTGLSAVAYVMWALIIGVLSGTVIGIVLFAMRGRSRSYPFGPFLAGGTAVVIFFGTSLVHV